jgi:hypothetical protein
MKKNMSQPRLTWKPHDNRNHEILKLGFNQKA